MNDLFRLYLDWSHFNSQSIKPLVTSSSATLYWQDGTIYWTFLKSNCRHQAVDVRASSYSLLQTICSVQWQEAVMVLVKPLSDSFQAKVKLEKFGYPSLFADFFSFYRGSTVSSPCQSKSIFALSITVVLPSCIVNVGVIYSSEIDFKTVKLTKEMPGNCVYEEYGWYTFKSEQCSRRVCLEVTVPVDWALNTNK